jgi:hypothetical protein
MPFKGPAKTTKYHQTRYITISNAKGLTSSLPELGNVISNSSEGGLTKVTTGGEPGLDASGLSLTPLSLGSTLPLDTNALKPSEL